MKKSQKTKRTPKTFDRSQIVYGIQIRSLSKIQYRLLNIFISFYKTYRVVAFGQAAQAKRAKCHRMTVHRTMKLFESLGWIKILSGLDPLNDSRHATNIYSLTPEFEEFIKKTNIRDLMFFLIYKEKDAQLFVDKNRRLQRENVTPNVTQINKNLYIHKDRYEYTYRGCGNVHNSENRIHNCVEINRKIEKLPISYEDKVKFSSYSERVIEIALEKLSWVGSRFRIHSLGGFLNTALRKTAATLTR